MVRKEIIYLLYDDSGLSDTCYVGKTINISFRLKQHINDDGNSYYKSKWIKFLKHRNVVPKIKILEEVKQSDNWRDREIFWISKMKSEGYELCNTTKGGDGGPIYFGKDHHAFGKEKSREIKDKISNSLKGRFLGENNPFYGKNHDEKTRKRMSDSHKSVPLSENHKQSISIANRGKKIDSETKRKMSISSKGKVPWNKGKSYTEQQKLQRWFSKAFRKQLILRIK